MVMPQTLPAYALATVGRKPKCPLKTRYPEKVSSVSSGTGSPTMPSTSRQKIARCPYCAIGEILLVETGEQGDSEQLERRRSAAFDSGAHDGSRAVHGQKPHAGACYL